MAGAAASLSLFFLSLLSLCPLSPLSSFSLSLLSLCPLSPLLSSPPLPLSPAHLALRVRILNLQVIGVEALITREVRNTHRLFLDHLIQVRKIPLLAHTISVLCLESNLGFESQHLLHYLSESNFPRWISLAEAARGELGFLTTSSTKEKMCLSLREALSQGSISYHPNFFSHSLGVFDAKRRIKDEVSNFSIITEPPKTHGGKVRKTYTGKLGGQQDDTAIALQLAVCSTRIFFQSPKYSNFQSSMATQYVDTPAAPLSSRQF